MWMLSLRELAYRSRRIVIAVLVVAVVFGIAVAVDGVKRTLRQEPNGLTEVLGVDRWVVREGNRSPFAPASLLPASAAAEVAALPGVKTVHPVVVGRATITSPKDVNANVVGFGAGRGRDTRFPLTEGRRPRKADEAVVTTNLGVAIGDRVQTTTGRFTVVGLVEQGAYNAGAPTLFMTPRAAQKAEFDGQPYISGVGVDGRITRAPAGTTIVTNEQTIDDLRLTIDNAATTIDVIALLTWLVAVGVIAAIVYMSVIEQTRNFAILRATGSPGRVIVGSLVIQSVVVSVAAAVLSVPLAFLLRLGMPMTSTITVASIAQIVLIGIVVGVVASIAAARRALTIDPALAFGGA